MEDTDRKKWSTPTLKIFTRATPEERVLSACKISTIEPLAPNVINARCRYWAPGYCVDCSQRTIS